MCRERAERDRLCRERGCDVVTIVLELGLDCGVGGEMRDACRVPGGHGQDKGCPVVCDNKARDCK
eukprot:scaffold12464_cov123-Isochrysis_galbana.AAC.3